LRLLPVHPQTHKEGIRHVSHAAPSPEKFINTADRDSRIPCAVEPALAPSHGKPTPAKTYRKQKLFVEIKE
jgi:hypothetical protein